MKVIKLPPNAAGGIAVAPAFRYSWSERPVLFENSDKPENASREWEAFCHTREAVMEELEILGRKNPIFLGQKEIAGDILLLETVKRKLKTGSEKGGIKASQALLEAVDEMAAMLEALPDSYIRERANDVRDVGRRFLEKLSHQVRFSVSDIKKECILVAKRIQPSDMMKLDKRYIKGIICEEGTYLGHEAILSAGLQIPFLAGTGKGDDPIPDGMLLCMDAKEGILVCEPDEAMLENYRQKQNAYEGNIERQDTEKKSGEKTKEKRKGIISKRDIILKDGKKIGICANVGSLEEIKTAKGLSADGIGLFRTEFFFMNHTHFPSEEEQFLLYSEAAKEAEGELVIRLLDIGGDKGLPYFPMDEEENPFLGWRGIRILLDREDILRTQVRALLQAGIFGDVKILVPMIAAPQEWQRVKNLIGQCEKELLAEGRVFRKDIPVGLMTETPAGVLLADWFAKEADFFSIGTNDLSQYIMAADRGNNKVSGRYDRLNPVIKKAIQTVVDAAHQAGIPVSLCGELAADPETATVLIAMGVDSLSMSPAALETVREHLLNSPLCRMSV